MSGRFQSKRISLNQVKDPALRTVLDELNGQVLTIQGFLGDFIRTDTERGLVRINAPLQPRVLDADPTTKTTFGYTKEIAIFNDILYRKFGLEGEDTDWQIEGSGLDHFILTNIGVNTHAQIDAHISGTSNPHTVTLEQAIVAGDTATTRAIFDGGLDVLDSDTIRLGTGNDAEIYFDGTNLIVSPSGTLDVQAPASATDVLNVRNGNDAVSLEVDYDGKVGIGTPVMNAALNIQPFGTYPPGQAPDAVGAPDVWLRADDLAGSDGADIPNTWTNRGSGLDWTNNGANPVPDLEVAEKNGRNAVETDGTEYYGDYNTAIPDGPCTVAVVYRKPTSVGGWGVSIGADGGFRNGFVCPANNASTRGVLYITDTQYDITDLVVGNSQDWHIIIFQRDASDVWSAYFNGVDVTNPSPVTKAGDVDAKNLFINKATGGITDTGGMVAELVIYHNKLSDSDRDDLYDYLNAFYAVNAPAGGDLTEWQDAAGTTLNIVEEDGSVGIGTATPEKYLHVQSDSWHIIERIDDETDTKRSALVLKKGTTGTAQDGIGVDVVFAVHNDAGTYFNAARVAGIAEDVSSGSVDGALTFWTNINGVESEVGRFNSSGYLGILQSNPVYELDVTGSGHFTGNLTVDGAFLPHSIQFYDNKYLYFGSGADVQIHFDSQDWNIDTTAVSLTTKVLLNGTWEFDHTANNQPSLIVVGSPSTQDMVEFKDSSGNIGATFDKDGYMSNEVGTFQPLVIRSYTDDEPLVAHVGMSFGVLGSAGGLGNKAYTWSAGGTQVCSMDRDGTLTIRNWPTGDSPYLHKNQATVILNGGLYLTRNITPPQAYIKLDGMTAAEVITGNGQPDAINSFRTLFYRTDADPGLHAMDSTGGTFLLEALIYSLNSGSSALPQQPIAEFGDGLIASDNPGNTSTLIQVDTSDQLAWSTEQDFQGDLKVDSITPSLGSTVLINPLEIPSVSGTDPDVAFGAAPSYSTLKILDRQAGGTTPFRGNVLYCSMETDTPGAWEWIPIKGA